MRDKTAKPNNIPQLANSPSARALGKNALKALLAGATFQYVKPLLAAEVRRIFPTAVGLPMELSYYTAAVAKAYVKGNYILIVLA